MNDSNLIERTPEEERIKDIRIALHQLYKDLERLARDVSCLYEVLDPNFYKENK